MTKPHARTTQQLERVMNSRAFRVGVMDAAMGEPFCHEYETWRIDSQQDYERGRQFSVCCKAPLMQGRKLNPQAVNEFLVAYNSKIIR